MNKLYVVFGTGQSHKVGGETFDMSTIAVIPCETEEDGRAKTFKYFGSAFCVSYYNDDFKRDDFLPYAPNVFLITEEDGEVVVTREVVESEVNK